MTQEYMKRCSTSLVIREIKIRITMTYYYIPVKMAKLQKSGHIKNWQECEGTGTLMHYWGECKMVQPLWKLTVCWYLKSLINTNSIIQVLHSKIFTQEKVKAYIKYEDLDTNVRGNFICNSPKLETAQVPINRRLDK